MSVGQVVGGGLWMFYEYQQKYEVQVNEKDEFNL